jgi:hypothetical protein
MDTKIEGEGVTVCPGPNMAYFSKLKSLFEMTSHIYNKTNFAQINRPNMFVKELNLYIDYLNNAFEETEMAMTARQEAYLNTFASNLKEGIQYYHDMFSGFKETFKETKSTILSELELSKEKLQMIKIEIENLSISV